MSGPMHGTTDRPERQATLTGSNPFPPMTAFRANNERDRTDSVSQHAKPTRDRLLMVAFNDVDYDGRVQRAAETLADRYRVTVLGIGSARGGPEADYEVRSVPLDRIRPAPLRHVVFWLHVWREALRLRPRVIYAHDYYMAFPGWVAARLVEARLVYDAHELIIPEPGVRLGLRRRLFYRLERWVVGRTDAIIAANEERAALMSDHYQLPMTPHVVRNIPPEPVPRLTRPEVEELYPLLRRPDPGRIRLVYQGALDMRRGIAPFVAAMPLLDDRFELILIGGGPDEARLRQEVEAAGITERVHFLGRIRRDQLHDVLRCCDIGIVTYSARGLNNIYCAPNKLYEYTQAGIPVIATCQPPLRAALERWRVGLTVGCGPEAVPTPTEIADTVRHLAEGLAEFRQAIPAFLEENNWRGERAALLAAIEEAVA